MDREQAALLEKDANDFWSCTCMWDEHSYNQHNLDELLAAMCCLFPSLERVRVNNSAFQCLNDNNQLKDLSKS